MKIGKLSLSFIGFLQAVGLFIYCSLIAIIFWNADKWFGNTSGYLAPLLALSLFTTSALVSAVLTLGYPSYLLWHKKEPVEALKLVIYTAIWLLIFTGSVITLLIYY